MNANCENLIQAKIKLNIVYNDILKITRNKNISFTANEWLALFDKWTRTLLTIYQQYTLSSDKATIIDLTTHILYGIHQMRTILLQKERTCYE